MNFAQTLKKTADESNEHKRQEELQKKKRIENAAIEATARWMKHGEEHLLHLAERGENSTFLQIPLVYHLGNQEGEHPSYQMITSWLDQHDLKRHLHSRHTNCHSAIQSVHMDGKCRSGGYFLLEVSWRQTD